MFLGFHCQMTCVVCSYSDVSVLESGIHLLMDRQKSNGDWEKVMTIITLHSHCLSFVCGLLSTAKVRTKLTINALYHTIFIIVSLLTFEPWVACSHHRCKQTPVRLWGVPAPWLKGRVDHLYASLHPHASSWQVEWCLRGNEWSS